MYRFRLSVLWFCYLLFSLGICQCIIRSLCKMCCAACETYWHAFQDITCFLWHKLMSTKRRNRHPRIRDVELGFSSSDESDFSNRYHHPSWSKKRNRERRQWYKNNSRHRHHHHVKLKTRQISVHIKDGSRRLRNSRQLQLIKFRNPRKFSKRRRLRWSRLCKWPCWIFCMHCILLENGS